MEEKIFINGIETVFLDDYDEVEIKQIVEEFEKAIKFAFEDKYIGEIVKIEIMKKYSRGDDKKINGCFNSKTRILQLKIKSLNNIKKIRNVMVHELIHARFSLGLLKIDIELFRLGIRGDYNIYMINEYMACKYSNDYSYVVHELKEWLQKDFLYYYKNRKSTDDKIRKDLCSLICSIIVASDKMKELGKNRNKIKYKDINDIAEILRKIDFLPTKSQYNELKELLTQKGFF